MPFPSDFAWGAATASYQIEGAVGDDGRGESIWDRFSHTPGKVERGETGDVACDHYHRWQQDVELMSSLSLRAYRFSIAWPRVIPDGEGATNQAGIDFYSRLVDCLLESGITPFATLYHWDLPQALQDRYGGWVGRETPERFADYAQVVFRALGDRVTNWITLNEPWCSAFLGHYEGVHAPGARDLAQAVKASHHLLLGHGRAVAAFRSLGMPGRIGATLNLQVSTAATDSDADRDAAELSDGYNNRWFLDPLFRGDYPADIVALFAEHDAPVSDVLQDGDLAAISAPLDFLGINYYFRSLVSASRDGLGFTDDSGAATPPAQRTEMGWSVDPSALTEQLTRIYGDYGSIPIYVTENGAAYPDRPESDGTVNDPQRTAYLRDHIAAMRQAIDAGVDVRGYFAWSLMDNFEWALGYRPRFGIVRVDYDSQRRTPKQSALWYRDLIARNGLEAAGAS